MMLYLLWAFVIIFIGAFAVLAMRAFFLLAMNTLFGSWPQNIDLRGGGSGTRTARRWGDNDIYFGPFTFAFDTWKHWAIELSSRDDEDRGCSLRINLSRWTLIVALPNVIQPYREKITPKYFDAATIERMGRDWYWSVDRRVYGFTLSDGHLSVKFGRQTHDSSTEQSWGCFLPWTQWRHVRHSMYDLSGKLFWTEMDRFDFDAWLHAKDKCPSVTFAFKDFDGEAIEAKTNIEEREWRFGEGIFKWLSILRKPKVHRSLDIQFSKETGRRKGSWKGGTIGHSIEMLPGELHESAFLRYCVEHGMTFIGRSA